jgi:hypothetical protein
VARVRDEAAALLEAFDTGLELVDARGDLLHAMRAAWLELRAGTVYLLREPLHPFDVRYVGETMTDLRVRLAGHRSKRELPVGRWIAALKRSGLEPIHEPSPPGVSARLLKDVERHFIYQYTWQGADLLNRGSADEDSAAYLWMQQQVEFAYRYEASVPYGDEKAEEWDGEKPEPPPHWDSLRRWRYRVRGALCPECEAQPGQPCLLRQTVASRRQGPANHLRRVAARVRYDTARGKRPGEHRRSAYS